MNKSRRHGAMRAMLQVRPSQEPRDKGSKKGRIMGGEEVSKEVGCRDSVACRNDSFVPCTRVRTLMLPKSFFIIIIDILMFSILFLGI